MRPPAIPCTAVPCSLGPGFGVGWKGRNSLCPHQSEHLAGGTAQSLGPMGLPSLGQEGRRQGERGQSISRVWAEGSSGSQRCPSSLNWNKVERAGPTGDSFSDPLQLASPRSSPLRSPPSPQTPGQLNLPPANTLLSTCPLPANLSLLI